MIRRSLAPPDQNPDWSVATDHGTLPIFMWSIDPPDRYMYIVHVSRKYGGGQGQILIANINIYICVYIKYMYIV
jgi:hypothetical protein